MRKQLSIFFFVMTIAACSIAQETYVKQDFQKGQFFAYWGWNTGWFSNSNISFKGPGYNFSLSDVVAHDRETPFTIKKYFNPATMTIPQYNYRLGYFFRDRYSLSIGMDHMKYVVDAGQSVTINGNIENTESGYDGIYSNDNIRLVEGFLELEHTDGLNYLNLELRHINVLYAMKNFSINFTEGLGVGALIPKTNATLLNNEKNDEFHLSGYGIDALLGVNLLFYHSFFIQTEMKGGFFNMPDVRTTNSKEDRAKQNFFFGQLNLVFGGMWRF